MFIVTRIWISISDLDLNSIIELHNENLKNLVNTGHFGFILKGFSPDLIN